MPARSRRILVTGASGFIGRRLCSALLCRGAVVKGTARRLAALPEGVTPCPVGEIGGATDWREALQGLDAVIHLAAQLSPGERAEQAGAESFAEVNARGTENLARQAAAAGVRRFVFVSTVKVHGETTSDSPFREGSELRPADAYARSKCDAEQRLRALAESAVMELTVVRPPLVYGPGGGGNVLRLIQAIDTNVPLPFGRIRNKRSLVSVDNLVEFLWLCATEARAAGEIFLVSDGEDLSTADLVRAIAKHLGRRPRLLPVPPGLLKTLAALAGRKDLYDRLCGSLQVDIGHARRVLGWNPPFRLDHTMAETVDGYRKRASPPPVRDRSSSR
jgi:UDP-glucose 4-epimerase